MTPGPAKNNLEPVRIMKVPPSYPNGDLFMRSNKVSTIGLLF
jgi:hypothetical protein